MESLQVEKAQAAGVREGGKHGRATCKHRELWVLQTSYWGVEVCGVLWPEIALGRIHPCLGGPAGSAVVRTLLVCGLSPLLEMFSSTAALGLHKGHLRGLNAPVPIWALATFC